MLTKSAGLHLRHHLPHRIPICSSRCVSKHRFDKHPQLHGKALFTVILNDINLLRGMAQILPLRLVHAQRDAFLLLLRTPPRREQGLVLGRFDSLHEATEVGNAICFSRVDGVLEHVPAKVDVVVNTQTVCVDEKAVDVLLWTVMQPGIARVCHLVLIHVQD